MGQAPGPGISPGRTRVRLAELAGIDLALIDRLWINLLDEWPGSSGKGDLFPVPEASVRARELDRPGEVLLLLGLGVARAFGLRRPEMFSWLWLLGGARAAVIPHTSGVCRSYNDRIIVESARDFLRRLPWREEEACPTGRSTP